MKKLDPQITKEIQTWLGQTPEERDVIVGATLLLRLNRNRAMFNSFIRRPDKYGAKVEYELRKHLRIRLAGLTSADVARMEKKVMPAAEALLAEAPVVSTDAEMAKPTKQLGKRADHDSLPPHVREYWEGNLVVRDTVKMLFEELKKMNRLQPCDRFDKLQMLAAAEEKYRKNLALYDAYDPNAEVAATPEVDEATAAAVLAARKKISRFKTRMKKNPTDATLSELQANVDIVLENGGTFTPSVREELTTLGVELP